MPIRDILLQLSSYEAPTPRWAFEAGLALSEHFGARLSAALCHVHIPRVSNYLADKLVGANEAIAAENRKSDHNARELLALFEAIAPPERRGDSILIECRSMVTPWETAARARLYDLTIVPAYGNPQTRFVAEGLIFESGRPVLLLPERPAGLRFERIAIGWDGSRAAARALADALPFCMQAGAVDLVEITGEKALDPAVGLAEAARHLAAHDVAARAVQVAAGGKDAGAALLGHCTREGTDLLVMGAYGHSRLREFVLGGATSSVLAEGTMPTFLSH